MEQKLFKIDLKKMATIVIVSNDRKKKLVNSCNCFFPFLSFKYYLQMVNRNREKNETMKVAVLKIK